jgi:hypothetical protein
MLLAEAVPLHDDRCYLTLAHNSIQADRQVTMGKGSFPKGASFAFISGVSWHGPPGDWKVAAALAESIGMTVVTGDDMPPVI